MCMPHGNIRMKKVFLLVNKYIHEYLICDLHVEFLSRFVVFLHAQRRIMKHHGLIAPYSLMLFFEILF